MIHKSKFAVLLIALCFTAPSATAGRTYTPAELGGMVESGHYPAQGKASSETKQVDYGACIVVLEQLVGAVKANYPAETIVSTNILRIEKVWTNDAAITVTCSALDRKLVITTAPYL